MAGTWKALYSFDDILGSSASLQQAIGLAQRASKGGYPALLIGESGTGKELFAHAIHMAGAQRDGPFVPVNSGTLDGQLAVAELCGYEPGSFTGADRHTRTGILDSAHRGTLFLDELQDMPRLSQSVLLRFLETGSFVRVGGNSPVQANVGVVAASNLPIDTLERKACVRSDLLYRLNSVVIEIPPLRERPEDIRPIAEKCLREELHFLGAVDEEVWLALSTSPYPWPGNARGLRNILLKAILRSTQDRIRTADLPPELWTLRDEPARNGHSDAGHAGGIRAVLEASRNNVSEAARRLGIHRSTLYRRLARSDPRNN
jgi:transcriptional regulator with PAS, ATPase and Fis domain